MCKQNMKSVYGVVIEKFTFKKIVLINFLLITVCDSISFVSWYSIGRQLPFDVP